MSLPAVPQLHSQPAATRRLVLLLVALLAGCGAVTFEYRPGTEIPSGPGMFTGEKGAIVYRIELGAARTSPCWCVNALRPSATASTLGSMAAECPQTC